MEILSVAVFYGLVLAGILFLHRLARADPDPARHGALVGMGRRIPFAAGSDRGSDPRAANLSRR